MPSIKELNFFGINSFRLSLDAYKKFFDNVRGEKAVGESSPAYLRSNNAAHEIKKLLPQCKIIIILRNPAERIFSDFIHIRSEGYFEGFDFDRFLKEKPKSSGGHYFSHAEEIERGMYYKHVKTYLDLFGDKRVKIFLFEDLKNGAQALLREIFIFLEVDPAFTPNTERKFNVSGKPVLPWLPGWIIVLTKIIGMFIPHIYRTEIRQKLLRINVGRKKDRLSDQAKAYLLSLYKNDILKLQQLIKRDLGGWLR